MLTEGERVLYLGAVVAQRIVVTQVPAVELGLREAVAVERVEGKRVNVVSTTTDTAPDNVLNVPAHGLQVITGLEKHTANIFRI